MEEVAIEVMQVDKATELFQDMEIVNMNMGNFNFGGKQSRKKIGYREEGEGNNTRRIGLEERLLKKV